MSETTSRTIVVIDEANEGQVRITRKDRDKFFVSVGEAVSACAAFAKAKDDFTGQVTDLLEDLSN